jgi:hypothetical protein
VIAEIASARADWTALTPVACAVCTAFTPSVCAVAIADLAAEISASMSVLREDALAAEAAAESALFWAEVWMAAKLLPRSSEVPPVLVE